MTQTRRPTKLPSPGERAYQDQIVDLARICGWRVVHFGAGRTKESWRTATRYDSAGFPDLTLLHEGRQLLLFREVKGARTPVTARQLQWGEWLLAAGQDWAVWRPADWPQVVAVLSGGRAVLGTTGSATPAPRTPTPPTRPRRRSSPP